jgi:IclR family transcriptional regulator, acetate operon repressor
MATSRKPDAQAEPASSAAAVRMPDAKAQDAREQIDGVSRILVLAKTRAILDAFTPQDPELSIPELTVLTGLPASTCFRIVRNLAHDGMLERVGDRYRIGLAIVRWASSALESRSLVLAAEPTLAWLRDTTGESALLSVREGPFAVLVALASSRHAIVRQLHVGEYSPLNAGSRGKVILAFDPDALRAIEGVELTAFTSNTITDSKKLLADVERVRRTGYAASAEERNVGAAGVHAPVFDQRGRLAGAVGLTGPVSRMGPDFAEDYAALVLEAADRIAQRLGRQGGRTQT